MDCIHVNQPIIFTWQFFANNLILKKFHQHFFLSSFIHLLPENFNNMKLSRGNDVDLVCLSYHIYIYIYGIYIYIYGMVYIYIYGMIYGIWYISYIPYMIYGIYDIYHIYIYGIYHIYIYDIYGIYIYIYIYVYTVVSIYLYFIIIHLIIKDTK